jgi:hypothetical protein
MLQPERCNQCGGPLAPTGDALVDVLRCTGCGREIPAAAMGQLCACGCGCGAEVDARRTGAIYATDACKSRAWRRRSGYRLQAVREACQTPLEDGSQHAVPEASASRASNSATETLWRAVANRRPNHPRGWWRGKWQALPELAQAQAERWVADYGIDAWIEPNTETLPPRLKDAA